MKANELMLGDWVVYRGDTEYTSPVRIEGMDILIGALITEDRDDVGFDGIEPIPLTAEILEKNGFRHGDGIEKRWYNMKIEDKKVTLYQSNTFYSLKIDEGIWPKLNNIYIHFVHQLQNALRLCGIEKEIEL